MKVGVGNLRLNNVFTDRVQNESSDGMQTKLVHDPGPVRFHGPDANVQNCTNFFVGLVVGHQLDDLPFPGRQSTGTRFVGSRQYSVVSLKSWGRIPRTMAKRLLQLF